MREFRAYARLSWSGCQYDSYEKNGVTIPTAEVHVRELVMLGSASARSNGSDLEFEQAVA